MNIFRIVKKMKIDEESLYKSKKMWYTESDLSQGGIVMQNKNTNDVFGFVLKTIVALGVIAMATIAILKLFDYLKTKKLAAYDCCDCCEDDWLDDCDFDNLEGEEAQCCCCEEEAAAADETVE